MASTKCAFSIQVDLRPEPLHTSRPITNRGKLAFRSLRDEALTKFGEFIGAGREFSICDSLYTLCEAVIGMIRRSISMLLRAGSCHSIRSALCRRQRTVR